MHSLELLDEIKLNVVKAFFNAVPHHLVFPLFRVVLKVVVKNLGVHVADLGVFLFQFA